MHALHSHRSFHAPCFEFRVSFHASGDMFPCSGAIMHHILVLKFSCLYSIFHVLLEWHFVPLDRSSICVHVCTHSELSHFHLMASYVSVAEVHLCLCKSIIALCMPFHSIALCMLGCMLVHRVCHFIACCMLGCILVAFMHLMHIALCLG